jgi:hypothetical protein
MPTLNEFALLITSVLISVGIISSLSQMGVVMCLFGKHGFVLESTGGLKFVFLSDTFVQNPGLANAWLVSVIPSVAVAAIVIHTSLTRDMAEMKRTHDTHQFWFVNWSCWICLWMSVLVTHIGLLMLVVYNVVKHKDLHILGVVLMVTGGLVLNAWVLFLDYGVARKRWHPQLVFDIVCGIITVVSIGVFLNQDTTSSVVAEWILLALLTTIHALLPIRGARIVLSPARPRRNACLWFMASQ